MIAHRLGVYRGVTVEERFYFRQDNGLGIGSPNTSKILAHLHRYGIVMQFCDKTGGVWLDAGCGSGYGTEIISWLADSVIGIDKDLLTIQYAKKHHSRPNLQFAVGDICNLPLDTPDIFDAVIAADVIEHVLDCESFLERVYKLLKPNGRAVITTPTSTRGGSNPLNPYHLNELTEKQFVELTSRIFDKTRFIIGEAVMLGIFDKGQL